MDETTNTDALKPGILQPVKSSNIEAMGHDPETCAFFVQWKRGNISAYDGVTPELAAKVMAHESAGTAVRSLLLPSHKHRYLPQTKADA